MVKHLFVFINTIIRIKKLHKSFYKTDGNDKTNKNDSYTLPWHKANGFFWQSASYKQFTSLTLESRGTCASSTLLFC